MDLKAPNAREALEDVIVRITLVIRNAALAKLTTTSTTKQNLVQVSNFIGTIR